MTNGIDTCFASVNILINTISIDNISVNHPNCGAVEGDIDISVTGGTGNYSYSIDNGINFFDTADVYGNGYGEEIINKAFNGSRHEIVLATKFGYDIYSNTSERKGHKELPQKFSKKDIIIMNMCGRGDKDIFAISDKLGVKV